MIFMIACQLRERMLFLFLEHKNSFKQAAFFCTLLQAAKVVRHRAQHQIRLSAHCPWKRQLL